MVRPLLELRDVSFSYAKDSWALRNVSLTVFPGERVSLLGSNGAGKSTLLLMMNGVEQPCRGSVWLDGEQLSGAREHATALRRSVGVLLQDPDDQLIAPIVDQDVAIGPLLAGVDAQTARRTVREALVEMEIEHLASRPVHELSFGEKKRVALAGIIALQPRILLLDEPTAGLDPSGVRALTRLLEGVQKQGCAIVQTTHDVTFAYEWSDSAYVLESGHLLKGGDAGEVLSDGQMLESAGLELPIPLRPTLTARRFSR
jgi:cobalt/nickel transport system ATP-binding protein